MRIYSKVAFVFHQPNSRIIVRENVSAGEIKDVPDWVADDPTFELGKKAGLIEVLENREQQILAEKDAAKATRRKKGLQ